MRMWAWIMAVLYMWKRRTIDRPGWDIAAAGEKGDGPQFVSIRRWFTDNSTISELFIDGSKVRKCYFLEDCVRGEKIAGKTAIPAGTYEIIISYSNKFKQHMPLLLNVPGFAGIRIHPGNTHKDTEGCLLPGMDKTEDNRMVIYSRKAYADLYELLKVMCAHEKVYIKIANER